MEILGIIIISLVVLFIIGVPIGMSFALVTIFLVIYFQLSPESLMPMVFYQIKSPILLAIPFFIALGALMAESGLSAKLIDCVNIFVGRVRGGLGAVTVVASAAFGAIAGSCSAAVCCIGTIIIPKLEEHGYPRGYATALVACSSILGQLIPPSIPMILFALVTWQSVLGCWLATVGPGLLTVLSFCLLNYIMVRKFPILVAPKLSFKKRVGEFTTTYYRGIPVLILPLITLGGVYGGVFTPTEASGVAVAYTIIVYFLSARLSSLKGVKTGLLASGISVGALIGMFIFILMLARILVYAKAPDTIAAAMIAISSNKYVLLGLINIFLIVIGMLMDDLTGTLLAASLLFPLMEAIGIHPLHFAAILGVNLGLGNVTPPTAPILYLAGHIGKCDMKDYIKPALKLMWIGMLPILIATTYWPDLCLFIPRITGYMY